MANRPNYIDIRSQSHGPLGTGLPSPRSLPSPRLHVAGDVPPALSPLDAFAAQSRALAKQLEESMSNSGRRMSRLPPLAIEETFRERPNYFRSMSAEATPTSPQTNSPGLAMQTEVEAPPNRPISVHPTLSGGPLPSDDVPPPMPSAGFGIHDEERHRGRNPSAKPRGLEFDARTEQSPQPLDREQQRFPTRDMAPSVLQPRPSADSIRARANGSKRPIDMQLGINNYDSRALAPPRSPFGQRTPSPRSMSNDSSDDDYNHYNRSNAPRVLSPERKLSSSTGMSTSPTSPHTHPARSPSISSEISLGGTRLPRPAFNFSRPLSRASTIGLSVDPPPARQETPSRQASSDSQPFILADDSAHTPVSMHSDGFPDNSNETGAAPSYVYSRFSLPRGKMLQRNSLIFQDNLTQTQFSWEQPIPLSNVQPHNGAPPSPPSRPSTSPLKPDAANTRPSLDPGRPSYDPSLDSGRPSLDPRAASSDYMRPSTDYSTPSLASSSTVKAKSQHSGISSIDCSAEEHVSKAIEFHEAGALTKSTYHLRLAARQNHPTGMLLYALACRHGWGCRPNQKEGVAWLRKAADSASLEIADDEDLIKGGKTVDILERKTRKAQFALSIYELGVSHMNGWGIEQDKVLALRCFEIAGSWGDADALAESGFCYAQGIGCKKNLKKSARFYRQAEAKGISMIGNSWIYKAKYNDEGDQAPTSELPRSVSDKDKEKKAHRTIFGRTKTTS